MDDDVINTFPSSEMDTNLFFSKYYVFIYKKNPLQCICAFQSDFAPGLEPTTYWIIRALVA
jgi:hypothetical protein